MSKISIFDLNFDFLTKFRFFVKISIFDLNFDFSSKFRFFVKNFDVLLKISIFDLNFDFWWKILMCPYLSQNSYCSLSFNTVSFALNLKANWTDLESQIKHLDAQLFTLFSCFAKFSYFFLENFRRWLLDYQSSIWNV